METFYVAKATAWGGRQGKVASSDGVLEIELSVPKAMGGEGGPGTNPEQLFAAGYAACFHSALKLIATQAKVDLSESAVSAHVGMGKVDAAYGLEVELVAEMPGVAREQAQELMEQAHQVCPYSNATRNNVAVTLTVHE